MPSDERKEKKRKYHCEWRHKNPEKMKAIRDKWRKTNRDVVNEYSKRSRAKKKMKGFEDVKNQNS